MIAQAISLFRAIASRYWHHSRAAGARAPSKLSVEFDLERICGCLQVLEAEKREWEGFFKANAITPIRISYEIFADDVSVGVKFLGEKLGLDWHDEAGPEIGFHKTSDALTGEWVERVRRHVLRMT